MTDRALAPRAPAGGTGGAPLRRSFAPAVLVLLTARARPSSTLPPPLSSAAACMSLLLIRAS